MNNVNIQLSPALRIEAWSINCISHQASLYAANRNLLTVAESLPAHYVKYLLLMRLFLLIHLIRRTPRNSTGNRIKRKTKNSGTTIYNFDGLYEIARTPGEGERHTLYFKGLYGDVFSQLTRNDAQLVSHGGMDSTGSPQAPTQRLGGFGSRFTLCSDISGSCSQYYMNTAKYYWIKGVVEGYTVVSR